MLAIFAGTTLADDINLQLGGKSAFALDDFGFDSGVIIIPGYGAVNPFKQPSGNVDGKMVFTATKPFSSMDNLMAFLLTLTSLVNTKGLLTLTANLTTRSFANATLKNARRVRTENTSGVCLSIQYQFELTTIA